MTTDSKPKAKPRGLGRGLNALFEDEEQQSMMAAPAVAPQMQASIGATPAGRFMIGIEQIYPNADQPRQNFNTENIEQLAESLREHGMLQPITVRERPNERGEGRFQIVAGERRWRAAQMAQMHEVPVNIVTLDDGETLEIALIENLQREDLNPVEEALGYHRLLNEYNMTQEEISKTIGKSRSHIANMVRLLNLPPLVTDYLRAGKISAGHARALVNAKDPETLAKYIVDKGLNVRESEALAGEVEGKKRKLIRYHKDADTIALENDLMDVLGMKVTIDSKDEKSGHLRIEFKSLDQLDDLIHRLSKIPKVMMGD